MTNKTKLKAYDLPLRIFHWLFALLFLNSFLIAKLIDDDSALYVYHMLSGIMMAFMVVLRILWGIFAKETSNLKSFKLRPQELKTYFTTILSSKSKRYLGHNPASSYAAFLMFFFTLGLVSTGLLMSLRINKHFFEELHELFANGFLLTVLGHIMGVVFHQIKHRDGLPMSMLSGYKNFIEGEEGISSFRPFVATLFVGLTLGFALLLNNNFDRNTQSLRVFGTSVQLGESHGEHGEHDSRYKGEDDDDDDDDDDD